MNPVDFLAVRRGLAELDPSASHTASGDQRAKIDEIFAPEQHAGALDPNVTIVLGARGTGKSFWAGVLGDDETRKAAAGAYPNLGLENVRVRFGYTGLPGDGSVTRATIDAQVPQGEEGKLGVLLWRCVILRAMQSVSKPDEDRPTIGSMMKSFADPEEWEATCERIDRELAKSSTRVLVVFDALDSLAIDWERLRNLTDALLEVAWSARGYQSLRTKLFMRPDQLRDLGLRFVEVPKLTAGATNLKWSDTNLYGMLFSRIAAISQPAVRSAFSDLLREESIALPPRSLRDLRNWPLAYNRQAQASVFIRLAGAYMGRSHKKGRTYDWPLRHLADGHGDVTPRSFLTLAIEAARLPQSATDQAITAEGIRHGLKAASKTRVDQLDLEFPWIKRALAPLARLQVPCELSEIFNRWRETKTIAAIQKQAVVRRFLPPFEPAKDSDPSVQLVVSLARIGVLTLRSDNRIDMPDLFRVAARLLRKGGVAPS